MTTLSPADLETAKAALLRLRRDPVWWIETTFKEPVIGKQKDVAQAVFTPGVTDVDVPSCHDSGKTHIVSRIAMAWLCAFPRRSKVVTTAPTWPQVEHLLWREMRDGYVKAQRNGAPLGGRMLTTRWDISEQWFAIGLSTDDPVNIQGYHAEHLLVIVDEADGIPPEMWHALDGLTTSGHCVILGIGNPLDPQSAWRKRVNANTGRATHRLIRISHEDVTPLHARYPFLLSPSWVEDKRDKWGETSPLYLGKVLAQWPDQGADTVIPMSWLLAAKGRQVPRGLRTLFADVARFGTNRTVLSFMEGGWLARQASWEQADTVVTASRIVNAMDSWSPVQVGVDANGLGAGVYDQVRYIRPQAKLYEYNAQRKPIENSAEAEMYADLASQWWWEARTAFEKNEVGFAMENPELVDDLINELNQARYGYVESGRKIKVNKYGLKVTQSEMTMDVEERASRSPDLADSFVGGLAMSKPYLAAPGQTPPERPRVIQYHTWRPGAVNA